MELIKKSPYRDVDRKETQKVEASRDNATVYDNFKNREIRVGDVLEWIYSTNLAFRIDDDEQLRQIGNRVKSGYQVDLESNHDKFCRIEEAEKLANLESVKTPGDDEWEDSADTCHPQIAETIINYWSRMIGEFFKDGQLVKYRVNGEDKDGEKAKLAQRRGEFLSYYLLNHVDGFLTTTGSLFMQQACNGKGFLRAYTDWQERKIVVDGILTRNLVADSYMKSLKSGNRYTYQYYLYGYQIDEKVRSGEFCDFVYGEGVSKPEGAGSSDGTENGGSLGGLIADGSYLMLAQYCRIDLDRDGYKEPYVVVVCEETGCVAQIVPAFNEKSVFVRLDRKKKKVEKKNTSPDYEIISLFEYLRRNEDGKKVDEDTEIFIARIENKREIVEIPFLQNVKGGFYGLGIAEIMVDSVRDINSLTNDVIDSGKCSNWRNGLVSEHVTIKGQDNGHQVKIPRNGFLVAQFDGERLSDHFYELQRHEPSPVLSGVRAELIADLEKLDGSTNLNSGQLPKGDTPVGTVLALIEQGQKKYSAIMQMTYLGFREFYRLVDELLKELMPDDMSYRDSEGEWKTLSKEDFDDDGMLDVEPVADPNNLTNFQKMMKAQLLFQALGAISAHGGDGRAVIRRYIEAANICNTEEILPKDAQAPMSPDMLKYQLDRDRLNLEAMKAAHDYEIRRHETEIKMHEMRAEIQVKYATAQEKMANAESKNLGDQYTQEIEALKQREAGFMQEIEQYTRYIDQLNKMIQRNGNGNVPGNTNAVQPATAAMGAVAGDGMAGASGGGADTAQA